MASGWLQAPEGPGGLPAGLPPERREGSGFVDGLSLKPIPAADRDMLGRWKPDIRSYGGRVARLQALYAEAPRAIMTGRSSSTRERLRATSAAGWLGRARLRPRMPLGQAAARMGLQKQTLPPMWLEPWGSRPTARFSESSGATSAARAWRIEAAAGPMRQSRLACLHRG